MKLDYYFSWKQNSKKVRSHYFSELEKKDYLCSMW